MKKKSPRKIITIECQNCYTNDYKRKLGVSRYLTTKNRKNTAETLTIQKFCKYCNKRTKHKELK